MKTWYTPILNNVTNTAKKMDRNFIQDILFYRCIDVTELQEIYNFENYWTTTAGDID